MSDAIVTEGTLVEVQNPSTLAWVEVKEVTDFNGPGGASAVIDVTHLQSTRKEKRVGLPDEGQFSFTVNALLADAGQTILRNARVARTLLAMRVTFTDTGTTTASFSCYCLEFTFSGAVDAKVPATVGCEITGAVTYA